MGIRSSFLFALFALFLFFCNFALSQPPSPSAPGSYVVSSPASSAPSVAPDPTGGLTSALTNSLAGVANSFTRFLSRISNSLNPQSELQVLDSSSPSPSSPTLGVLGRNFASVLNEEFGVETTGINHPIRAVENERLLSSTSVGPLSALVQTNENPTPRVPTSVTRNQATSRNQQTQIQTRQSLPIQPHSAVE